MSREIRANGAQWQPLPHTNETMITMFVPGQHRYDPTTPVTVVVPEQMTSSDQNGDPQ